MKKLLIILALLTWGCSSVQMINSPYGKIHRYQKQHIKAVKQFNGVRTIKIP